MKAHEMEHRSILQAIAQRAMRARGLEPEFSDAAQAELLATLMFSPGYIREIMALGAQDAEAQHREIAAFLHGDFYL